VNPIRVFIKTYGCQMNERDSEQVARQLQLGGYVLAEDEESADVILLNTCSVRDFAEQKALRKMQNLAALKKRNPKLVLGFLGCMAQIRGEELFKKLPELDLIIGTQQFHRVADYVDARLENGKKISDVREEKKSQNEIKDHIISPPTAFVSVMQGCNMRCAFCIVPETRGAQRNRPMEDILIEVKNLVGQGIKEVTLLGQIVNLYGRGEFAFEGEKSPFAQLLYRLEEIENLERIRFTSPHPLGMKKDLIQAFKDLSKLCEHVHLPLQSGSDEILKKMRRSYTADQYRKIIEALRGTKRKMAFTTDIIVGFPGESDQDFKKTCELAEEIRFDNAFIFKYSPRENTPASGMSDQVSGEVKEERNQILLEIINRIGKEKGEKLIGQTVLTLVEGPSKTNSSKLSGRTRDNKIVIFEGNETLRSKIIPVRIEDSTGFTFYGKPLI
jgi:tRNA-2-methylthio-N6-dimethylallyladenosine synthase